MTTRHSPSHGQLGAWLVAYELMHMATGRRGARPRSLAPARQDVVSLSGNRSGSSSTAMLPAPTRAALSAAERVVVLQHSTPIGDGSWSVRSVDLWGLSLVLGAGCSLLAAGCWVLGVGF